MQIEAEALNDNSLSGVKMNTPIPDAFRDWEPAKMILRQGMLRTWLYGGAALLMIAVSWGGLVFFMNYQPPPAAIRNPNAVKHETIVLALIVICSIATFALLVFVCFLYYTRDTCIFLLKKGLVKVSGGRMLSVPYEEIKEVHVKRTATWGGDLRKDMGWIPYFEILSSARQKLIIDGSHFTHLQMTEFEEKFRETTDSLPSPPDWIN